MSSERLTDAEATRLLTMLKHALIQELVFPARGEKQEFELEGETNRDLFTVCIYRGRIQSMKYEIGARIQKNNILLLELHINPRGIHQNPEPDGRKITGNHWHVYSEQYGRTMAFPADDIQSDLFVENTIRFLTEFHVVEPPVIRAQLELL